MDGIVSLLFLAVYFFMALAFTKGSIHALRQYFLTERLPWQIVEGTIVAFEEQRIGRPRRSGKRTVFYPVFSYRWNGQTYRGFARRVSATIGKDFRPAPRTSLAIGDAVSVRVFPDQPESSRLEEKFHFLRCGMPGHIVTVLAGCIMMACGIYWAVIQIIA